MADLQIPKFTKGPYTVLESQRGVWKIMPPVQAWEPKDLAEQMATMRPPVATVFGGCVESFDDTEAHYAEGYANAKLLAAAPAMFTALQAIKRRAWRDEFESPEELKAYLDTITELAVTAIEEAIGKREVLNVA